MPVDTLSSLNVVFGAPLTTRFAFVVCFRNQEKKLPRCLASIARQSREHDFGVILISDDSRDGSVELCVDHARQAAYPVVVVSNKDRKYYTRNLFNAVTLLVTTPHTVIVELDGDDALEDRDVLGVLVRAYEQGARQTFGSFRLFGDDGSSRVGELGQSASDMSDPWNLDRCMAWMHPKTFRKELFEELPLAFFFEKDSKQWLRNSEDLILHPKMVELSQGRARHLPDILYVHDVSGSAHDFADERVKADYVVNRLAVTPHGAYITSLRNLLTDANTESPHFKTKRDS